MTAERARDRLDRGLPELVRAGDDPAILAYALSAIHGALEAYFRSLLASDQRVPRELRAVALDVGALSFPDIVDALHEHHGLPTFERSYVLEAHGYWQAQEHGDGFAWDRAGLEAYARYVARTLGELATPLDQPIAPDSASPPADPDRATDCRASLAATRPYRAVGSALTHGARLQASHVLLILAALVAVSLLLNWVESVASDVASRAAATPAATRLPAAASPAPQPGQAASPVAAPARPAATATGAGEWFVVANTDGEGVFLRRTPSIEDRLEPYEDGTRMRVIGPDREAEGRRWKHVQVGNGPVGWVPAEYLIPPPAR